MKQYIRTLTVFLSIIFAAQSYAQTTIYQWKDSQGRVNYTQIKPEYTIQQSTQAGKDEKAPLIPAQAQSQTKSKYTVKTFETSKAMLVHIKPRTAPPQEIAVDTTTAIETTTAAAKIDTPAVELPPIELKLALSESDQNNHCTTARHNLSVLEGYMEGKVNLLKLKNSDGTETTLAKDQIETAKIQTLKEVDAFCTK